MTTEPDNIDAHVTQRVSDLLDRLESFLPKGWGVMAWVYNRIGADLDVQVFASHDSPSALDIIRATAMKLIREESKTGRASAERWFSARMDGPPSDFMISAACVTTIGAHDHVRVWSRGGLAGELIVSEGDGAAIAGMVGLRESEPA